MNSRKLKKNRLIKSRIKKHRINKKSTRKTLKKSRIKKSRINKSRIKKQRINKKSTRKTLKKSRVKRGGTDVDILKAQGRKYFNTDTEGKTIEHLKNVKKELGELAKDIPESVLKGKNFKPYGVEEEQNPFTSEAAHGKYIAFLNDLKGEVDQMIYRKTARSKSGDDDEFDDDYL